jgi:hypothetical protein
MKLIQSSKVNLPIIYLVENDSELASLPLGIPFIRGNDKDYKEYVRLLEWEVLLRSALATGLPFKWEELLREAGYDNLYTTVAYSEQCVYVTGTEPVILDGGLEPIVPSSTISDFVADISYQVDIEVLKNLKVIPTWFSEKIEDAIKSNIMNSITWNPSLYNKKLDNVTGDVSISTQDRNLIIIDISGSIPKSIAKACLLLSKTMSTQFFADLIITGARSGLFDYSEVADLDIDQVYTDYGQNNESKDFRKIVREAKNYDNVIVFGDNHSPLDNWGHGKTISFTQAYELCKFKVNKIFSFHTTNFKKLAGYAEMFDCSNVEHIDKWVKHLA